MIEHPPALAQVYSHLLNTDIQSTLLLALPLRSTNTANGTQFGLHEAEIDGTGLLNAGASLCPQLGKGML
jgi:hypothetical protein